MEREILTEADLVQIINDELASTEAAAECRFSGVYSLQEPDESGCNWSMGTYIAGGIPAEISAPVVARVVSELQRKYNIKPDAPAS
jgi:hypothetical protein